MKKRTLAWLLTLVLVISLVPMAAMAVTCPHDSQSCTSNNDGTHTWTCNAATCDDPVRTEPCDYDGDICKWCYYNKSAGCSHDTVYSDSNYDGTHHQICANPDCEADLGDASCDYDGDGTCKFCGYNPTNCTHNTFYIDPNYDGTHRLTCANPNCKEDLGDEDCYYDENGTCRWCEYNPNEQAPDGEPKPKPSSGLDKVPKTGDNGTGIVITSLTVLALFAAAFHICDKKRAI